MTKPQIDNFFLKQVEPTKSCFLALRDIILKLDKDISLSWKYSMPFFCYQGKIFCYLRIDKKSKAPYMGVVDGAKIDHPLLEKGSRTRMKVFWIDANKDLPIKSIRAILKESILLRKK